MPDNPHQDTCEFVKQVMMHLGAHRILVEWVRDEYVCISVRMRDGRNCSMHVSAVEIETMLFLTSNAIQVAEWMNEKLRELVGEAMSNEEDQPKGEP